MKIEELGYNSNFEKFRIENKLDSFEIGRVIAEHKERYIIKTITGEFDAEITGNLRFTAKSREDFPAGRLGSLNNLRFQFCNNSSNTSKILGY